MEKQELKQRAEELRKQGLSIRKIASALTDETGESISKSSVDRLLKQEMPQTVQRQEDKTKEAETPAELGIEQPFNVMPSRDRIKPSAEVTAAANAVRLQRLELERRGYERKLRLLDQEEEVEAEEKRVALNERRLRLQGGGANQDPEQAKALEIELANLQQTRAELEDQKARLAEERHRLEMNALNDKIADLADKLDGKNRTGKGEFDVISEGLQAVNSQLASMQTNLFAWLNKNTTLQQFNPQRKTAEQRKEAGEELIKKVEKARANFPDCYVQGVGGYCASENAGRLPQCEVCRYMPKETMIGRGETGPLS